MSEGVVQSSDQVVADDLAAEATPIAVFVHGDVDDDDVAYARRRLEAVIDRITEAVPFARLKLTLAPERARQRPALVEAEIDVDGTMLRAQFAARELREAADLLQLRLRDKLEHRASQRLARRRRTLRAEPGAWRRGDIPADRRDYFDRPPEERQLVRRKTFALDEMTPDEAAFDMDQLDHEFYLFRDIASGEDAVLERQPDGTYRLTRLHPADVDSGPTAIELTVAEHAPARATLDDAIARLDAGGEPFVFYADSDTGRGCVVYRRYDGHYGLITPGAAPMG